VNQTPGSRRSYLCRSACGRQAMASAADITTLRKWLRSCLTRLSDKDLKVSVFSGCRFPAAPTRAAECRHPTGRERMGSPTCRHLNIQSCCSFGSDFDVAFQTPKRWVGSPLLPNAQTILVPEGVPQLLDPSSHCCGTVGAVTDAEECADQWAPVSGAVAGGTPRNLSEGAAAGL
jgi:hypothetical protein